MESFGNSVICSVPTGQFQSHIPTNISQRKYKKYMERWFFFFYYYYGKIIVFLLINFHFTQEEWVICRMFHKMGEKKNLMHGHNYLMRGSSFYNPTSLPPLLEPPPSLEDQSPLLQTINHQFPNHNQNPLLYHTQESDLKALINPLVSRPDILPGSSNSTTRAESKEAMLLKPFMWSQDFSFKELSNAIAKQCKKESDLRAHLQFDGENSKYYQNPFLFGGIPSVTVDDHSVVTAAMDAAAIDHVMSSEPAFRWW